jgi:hypothetical protein
MELKVAHGVWLEGFDFMLYIRKIAPHGIGTLQSVPIHDAMRASADFVEGGQRAGSCRASREDGPHVGIAIH